MKHYVQEEHLHHEAFEITPFEPRQWKVSSDLSRFALRHLQHR